EGAVGDRDGPATRVDAHGIAAELPVGDRDVAAARAQDALARLAGAVDGAAGDGDVAAGRLDVDDRVVGQGTGRDVEGRLTPQDAHTRARPAAGVADRQAGEVCGDVADDLEDVFQGTAVDEGRLRAVAGDGQVVGDVEVAGGGGVLTRPGDGQRVGVGRHDDGVGPRVGVGGLDHLPQRAGYAVGIGRDGEARQQSPILHRLAGETTRLGTRAATHGQASESGATVLAYYPIGSALV